jgi:hypothetical protein
MADATTYVAKYLQAVAEPLRTDGFAEVLADDCTFEGVGNSKAEILTSFQQLLDSGWVAHNPIATAAAGEFLVAVAENRSADGTTAANAGIWRFNDDGLVTEMVGRVPVEGQVCSADAATHVGTYLRAAEAINRGDMTAFGEWMAEDCTFEGVGSNKAEIVKFVQQGKSDGWLSHNPIGTAAAGEFSVSVYENRFADGHAVIGAGVLRWNANGLCVEIVGREGGAVGTVIG